MSCSRYRSIHVFLLVFLSVALQVLYTVASGCSKRAAIGISFGKISAANFSASSVYNGKSTAAQARLKIASSWCGQNNGSWVNDWIQVDLGYSREITGIAIQGRQGNAADVLLGFYTQISEDGVSFTNQTHLNGKTMIHELDFVRIDRIQFFWFPALLARFVRLRALKLLLIGNNARFCVRFELFGCPNNGLELFPVGFENGVVKDSQFSASTHIEGKPPYHARLNMPNSWCIAASSNEWLQTDLGLVLVITAITSQGDFGRNSNDMVALYTLSYARNTIRSFEFLKNGSQNKTFLGNNQTAEDPVMNLLNPNIVARYIRIHPVTGIGSRFCMRMEIFAKHPDGSSDLTAVGTVSMTSIRNGVAKITKPSIDIFSRDAWCQNNINEPELIQIDLGSIRLVTGVAVSGNPNVDSWVTKFSVRFGFHAAHMQDFNQIFTGTYGRTELAVSWLKHPRITRFVQIKPEEFVGNTCMRIRIFGTNNVPATSLKPEILSIAPADRHILIEIKNANESSKEIIGIHLKYSCMNTSYSQPCVTDTQTKVTNLTAGRLVNVTGLLPLTRYTFSVKFLFNDSWSVSSNDLNVTTIQSPSKSTSISCKILKVTSSSFLVSWTSLQIASSKGPIIGYNISVSKASQTSSFVILTNATSNTYSIKNLLAGTEYEVSVKPMTVAGNDPSCTNKAITLAKATSSGLTFLRKSELAMIITSCCVMFIVLSGILIKAMFDKSKLIQRKRRYKAYLKTMQYEASIAFPRPSNPEVEITGYKKTSIPPNGTEGMFISRSSSRTLPSLPIEIKLHQQANTDTLNRQEDEPSPKPRRKQGIGNAGYYVEEEKQD